MPSLLPRLVTIHPILVHVTLGVLPVVVIAYAVAAARRSGRWSFAGDVTLWIGATCTIGTAAFGLISNAVLSWPGGLAPWRWAHLAFALGATALLLGLAAQRARAYRRGTLAGGGALFAALVAALLYTVAGWLGGEVLVYRSGMAVEAAGEGAFAPIAADLGSGAAPLDVGAAMARLRASWARSTSIFGSMIVEHPDPASFDRIAKAAIDVQAVAQWLATAGATQIVHEDREERPRASPGASSAEHEEGAPRRTGAAPGAGEGTAEVVRSASRALQERARALETAARSRNWLGVQEALGGVTAVCARCHDDVRWKERPRPGR